MSRVKTDGGEAVLGVVGDADRFLLVGDADDPDDRAEALLAVEPHRPA